MRTDVNRITGGFVPPASGSAPQLVITFNHRNLVSFPEQSNRGSYTRQPTTNDDNFIVLSLYVPHQKYLPLFNDST
jgi:hypothetical protein